MPFNALHGSRDSEDARRELAMLFPSFKFSDEVPKSPLGKPSRQMWSVLNLQRGEGGVRTESNYVVTKSSNKGLLAKRAVTEL